MKDHKKRVFLSYIVLTMSCFFALEFMGHAATFEKYAVYALKVEGVLWSVRIGNLESFNSDIAMDALIVSNQFEERGYSQSAWTGENPGDLGPMWVIHNGRDEVLGACWMYYEATQLECTPLYVPFNSSLD